MTEREDKRKDSSEAAGLCILQLKVQKQVQNPVAHQFLMDGAPTAAAGTRVTNADG